MAANMANKRRIDPRTHGQEDSEESMSPNSLLLDYAWLRGGSLENSSLNATPTRD